MTQKHLFAKLSSIALIIILSTNLLYAQSQNKKSSFIDNSKFGFIGQGNFSNTFNKHHLFVDKGFSFSNAFLLVHGTVDKHFYYKLMFNAVKDPILADAYIGYKHNNALQLQLGAMRPMMSLDFLPSAASADFIHRSTISGHLVQAREVGLSILGDIKNWHYFLGIYNGNKLSLKNNNNHFYYMGRLQYKLHNVANGTLKIGVNAAYGDSTMIAIGHNGPFVSNNRTIYGSDLFWEHKQIFIKAEYLQGQYDTTTQNSESTRDVLSGYYATLGYHFSDKILGLARWQSWSYHHSNCTTNQITLGIKCFFGKYFSSRFNFDTYLPTTKDIKNKYGLSLMLQIAIL